mmetsp:Transcript_2769/g.4986  ORF Transcript_2769/g.4986 Transcript_2769/m.4986 type:complete len:200 (+) Transcript_2769:34-633(+)
MASKLLSHRKIPTQSAPSVVPWTSPANAVIVVVGSASRRGEGSWSWLWRSWRRRRRRRLPTGPIQTRRERAPMPTTKPTERRARPTIVHPPGGPRATDSSPRPSGTSYSLLPPALLAIPSRHSSSTATCSWSGAPPLPSPSSPSGSSTECWGKWAFRGGTCSRKTRWCFTCSRRYARWSGTTSWPGSGTDGIGGGWRRN